MSITKRAPNTIYLGGGMNGGDGGITYVNDLVASAVITPGNLIELVNDGGVAKWQRHGTAAGTFPSKAVALDQPLLNLGVDDNLAAGDLVLAGILRSGSTFWGIVPSGQNIVPGDLLESNGDGKLKEGTTFPVARALDSTGGAVVADTRVRAEVI